MQPGSDPLLIGLTQPGLQLRGSVKKAPLPSAGELRGLLARPGGFKGPADMRVRVPPYDSN